MDIYITTIKNDTFIFKDIAEYNIDADYIVMTNSNDETSYFATCQIMIIEERSNN